MKSATYLNFARSLAERYEEFRLPVFSSRTFPPETLHRSIDAIASRSNDAIKVRLAGISYENRPIRLFTVGAGAAHVLLWTQMHGDESTATMAVADILHYLTVSSNEPSTRSLLSALTLHFLPMLNPDGAAVFHRRTSQGIDMNRDAIALQTPEARLLKGLQRELKPMFGFNLHDQELSTVGSSKELTALAFLAPAFDEKNSDNAIRLRAKHLVSTIATSLRRLGERRLAKYNDAFEVRAFGDNMQKWGTSTILIESGHAPGDPEKSAIRRLNVIGILTGLYAIATKQYRKAGIRVYDTLPLNGKKALDLIIRGITIDNGGGKTTAADIGISYQVDTHTEATPVLADVGDLQSFIGLREIDGKGASIPQSSLQLGRPFEWAHFVTERRGG